MNQIFYFFTGWFHELPFWDRVGISFIVIFMLIITIYLYALDKLEGVLNKVSGKERSSKYEEDSDEDEPEEQ